MPHELTGLAPVEVLRTSTLRSGQTSEGLASVAGTGKLSCQVAWLLWAVVVLTYKLLKKLGYILSLGIYRNWAG